MSWLTRYRIKEFFRSSHFFYPITGMVLAIVLAPLSRWVDSKTHWTLLNYGPEGARAILGVLTGSMFTIMLFVFTMLLLAVQIASGQLTPRIIASAFRNRPIKLASGIFIFSFIYCLAAFGRVQQEVPELRVLLSIVFSLISIATFLYLIEYFAKSLRPIAVMAKTAELGKKVIEEVYPQAFEDVPQTLSASTLVKDKIFQTISYSGKSGVLLAFDMEGLKKLSKKHPGVITLLPQVGNFVSDGDPLFRLYDDAVHIPQKKLLQSVAFGSERTVTQDPAFIFRIIVDISIRALSPGINDPTTAVLGLDQVHSLLLKLGRRRLRDEGIYDEEGNLRLLVRTPNWEDFVLMAIREIRWYGAESFQVNRRLKALLEDLIRQLPPSRTPPLEKELDLLHRSMKKAFSELEDQQGAEESDDQGFGGRHQKEQM